MEINNIEIDEFIYYIHINSNIFDKIYYFTVNWNTQTKNGWLKLNLMRIEILENDIYSFINYNKLEKLFNGKIAQEFDENIYLFNFFGNKEKVYLTKYYKYISIFEYLNN